MRNEFGVLGLGRVIMCVWSCDGLFDGYVVCLSKLIMVKCDVMFR